MTAVDRLIKTAKSYVGYIEKKSNSQLDDFTANAGKNNYTSFARDFKKASGIDVQAQPWCATWVNMMFIYTFGADRAKAMLGGFSAYTPTAANYFRNMGRFFKKPVPGDVIFFKNSERIYHTGIVYAVDNENIFSIEGNTSSAKGVIANGGCVAMKGYSLNYSKIAGYGRPLYEAAELEEIMKKLKDIEGHYAEKHIEKLLNYGIANGYDDGTFRPDEPITRGQAAVMIANVLTYLGK